MYNENQEVIEMIKNGIGIEGPKNELLDFIAGFDIKKLAVTVDNGKIIITTTADIPQEIAERLESIFTS